MSIELDGGESSQLYRVWRVISDNRVNFLLLFVPIGIVCGFLELGSKIVFFTNFMAIIPLAAVLSDTTEQLAATVGDTLGGLLNATFGNIVELIVGVVALYRDEIRIVQTSMLGSILSNLLLVLGMSFVAGGYNRLQQSFNQTAAQTMSSLMVLACISLLLPAAYHASVPPDFQHDVITVSRLTSVVLLTIYSLYLFFQLKTHKVFFEEENEQEDEESEFRMNRTTCLIVLGIVTLVVAVCAEYLVGSIDDLVKRTAISKNFIGLILLPIVGNAAEHVTAIFMAMKNKINVTMNVAIGSSMQIALFMTPFLVIWGWFIDRPMSLYFSVFETVILFVSVYVANSLIMDGESNWLEGVLLVGTYGIIAITFWFYPDPTGALAQIPQ